MRPRSLFCDPFFCSLSDAASHSGPDDPGNFQGGFLEIAMDIVPADYKSLAFRVVNDLMLKSPATMISATAVTALWSAGRGYVQRGKRLKPGQWKRKKALVCV